MINSNRLVDSFLEMAAINSPSGREKRAADLIGGKLRGLGFDVVFDDAGSKTGGECGNLIATKKGTLPGVPPIILSAHLDTVSPTDGWGYVIEDGVIRSKGNTILGADDKAGIAAILEAILVVDEDGIPHGDIQIVLSVSEETGVFGAKNLDYSLINGKCAFVYDMGKPTCCVTVAAPSQDNIKAKIIGKAAHAGACPEDGINAIVAASRAIAVMKLGRIDFETTANIGVIEGGRVTNIVPEICSLKGEARSRDDDKLDLQVRHMVETIHEAAADMGAGIDIEMERSYQSFRLSQDDEVVKIAVSAARNVGVEPNIHETGGGSDANIFNKMGIPAVVIGIGFENAHSSKESMAVEDLVKSAEMAVEIIRAAAVEG